jgi:hypothetical protein
MDSRPNRALDAARGHINAWLLGLAFWGAIGVLWGWLS